MSTASTMGTPLVPARPSRSLAKETPKVPPRPSCSKVRDLSPDDRFAPSPLNEGFSKSPKVTRFSPTKDVTEFTDEPNLDNDTLSLSRPAMARMPSEVGDEGIEYGMAEKIEEDHQHHKTSPAPETRTVGDLELQAPRPSLPAKVDAVTKTTSEFAASLGLNKSAGSDIATVGSLRKKLSSSALSVDGAPLTEDEHGIPEIGRRVPMIPNAGDVQAPEDSDAPNANSRAQSTRGLPPGSYGLHSHGVFSTDKLETEYYEKRPDILQKEQKAASYNPHQAEYARSSADLNKIVNETHADDGGPTFGPPEEIAHEVQKELVAQNSPENSRAQSPRAIRNARISMMGSNSVHVDRNMPEANTDAEEVPILAPDMVAHDSIGHANTPAIEVERLAREEQARVRSAASHNTNMSYSNSPIPEIREEKVYEPLFNDEGSETKKETAEVHSHQQKFPSKDIWEDAPSSVHYTAEVNNPVDKDDGDKNPAIAEAEKINNDIKDKGGEEEETQHEEPFTASKSASDDGAANEPTNPALAFAKLQEKLAEDDAKCREGSPHHTHNFIPRGLGMHPKSPGFSPLASDAFRPTSAPRFPSRDIWEDTPDSHMIITTVDGDHEIAPGTQEADSPILDSKPGLPFVPARPSSSKPPIVGRSKPKPAASDRPKPAVPPRPSVMRPVGGKIAALQSGFMSDLNRRLQIGPQVPKKEEPAAPASVEAVPETEKAPLADARKGRARGPQRRAPAKATAPVASLGVEDVPVLEFSISKPQMLWSIEANGNIGFEGTVSKCEEAIEAKEKVASEAEKATDIEKTLDIEAIAAQTVATELAGIEAIKKEEKRDKVEVEAVKEAVEETNPVAATPEAEAKETKDEKSGDGEETEKIEAAVV
ncbi:hypothetical protein Cpir12675_002216 [Ceratocystis pirilliformis]|uniref:Altered inheritance of mitochondria protein 21 n=1 Tax=Ceratocystis pirilliformis TaxID=259994 RepID=A0ABR3ZAV6_9PEZI